MANKWNKMTLLQLKKALTDRGVDSKGKRSDLIERLVEYEKQQEQEKDEEQAEEDMQSEERDEGQGEDAQPGGSAETAIKVEEQPESMDTAKTEETEKKVKKEAENDRGGDDEVIMVEESADADHSEDNDDDEDDEDDEDDDDEELTKEEERINGSSGTHAPHDKNYKWRASNLLWDDHMRIERYKRKLENENVNIKNDVNPVKISCDSVDNRILLYPIDFEDFANTSLQEATKKALRVTTSTFPVASAETDTDDAVKSFSFINMKFQNETKVQEALPLLENLKENIQIFHKSSEKETKLDEFIQGFHDLVGIEADLTKVTLFTFLPPGAKVEDLHKLYPMAFQIKPHHSDNNAVYIYFSSEKEYNRNMTWLDENNPDPELRKIHSFILADILAPKMPDEEFQKTKRERKTKALVAYKARTGKSRTGQKKARQRKNKNKSQEESVTRAKNYERGVEGKMPIGPPKESGHKRPHSPRSHDDPKRRRPSRFSDDDPRRSRPSRFSDHDEVPRKRIDLGPSRGRRPDVVNPYIEDSVAESLQMIMGASARLQMAVAKGPTGPLRTDVVGRQGGMMGRSGGLQGGIRAGTGGMQGGMRGQQGGMWNQQGGMMGQQGGMMGQQGGMMGQQGGMRGQQGGMMGQQGGMLPNQSLHRGYTSYDDEDSFVATPSSFRVGYGGKQGAAAYVGTRVPDLELLRERQGGARASQGGARASQVGARASQGGAVYTNSGGRYRDVNPVRVYQGGKGYTASFKAGDYDKSESEDDYDDEALGTRYGRKW